MSSIDRADELADAWAKILRGHPIADQLFYRASEWGDWSKIWHVCGIGRAVAVRDPQIALRLSLALGIESAFVNGFVKSLFKRDRPILEGERPLKLRQPKTSSFPSGHASSAFMAAALLADEYPPLKPLYYGAAAVVAYSRIHVRIHHASDVAGGAAVGVGLGELAKRVLPLRSS
ncbi:MAG: phosphatase PAP2 family protein [Acidimicrobiales bacterium]